MYTLKNKEGIFLFKKATTKNGEHFATFQRLSYREEEVTVLAIDSLPYYGEGNNEIETLAIKAIRLHKQDEGRVHRASLIMRYKNPANTEQDFIYTTARGETFIKSTEGKKHYQVTPKICQCQDHKNGHICKHRIAAWMNEEMNGKNKIIPYYYKFLYCFDCGFHHWVEIAKNGEEVCHGLEFDPRKQENIIKTKTYNFTSARNSASLEITIGV